MVWSPFSNLWLYGVTTDVPRPGEAGLTVCLGTDWGRPERTTCWARSRSPGCTPTRRGWALTDAELAQMVTCLPGDVLARAWQLPVGRLVAGALADLVVIDQRRADPWASLVAARERDVRLVVVGGRPVWGTSALMSAAGRGHTTAVRMGSVSRRVTLVRPDDATKTWTWTDLLARLNAVRAERRAGSPRRAGGPLEAPRP